MAVDKEEKYGIDERLDSFSAEFEKDLKGSFNLVQQLPEKLADRTKAMILQEERLQEFDKKQEQRRLTARQEKKQLEQLLPFFLFIVSLLVITMAVLNCWLLGSSLLKTLLGIFLTVTAGQFFILSIVTSYKQKRFYLKKE